MQGQADTLYASAVHARKKTHSQRNDKKLRKEEGEMGVSIKKHVAGDKQKQYVVQCCRM